MDLAGTDSSLHSFIDLCTIHTQSDYKKVENLEATSGGDSGGYIFKKVMSTEPGPKLSGSLNIAACIC